MKLRLSLVRLKVKHTKAIIIKHERERKKERKRQGERDECDGGADPSKKMTSFLETYLCYKQGRTSILYIIIIQGNTQAR